MFEQAYQREMDRVSMGLEERSKLVERMVESGGRQRRRLGRTALIAAAVCAALALTAAAYVAGAFDFFETREEYALLGQSELYERYARRVGQSATAENGDELTIDRIAMDGNFCVIFYSVRTREAMPRWSDRGEGISSAAPDLWQAERLQPTFGITASGEEVAGRYYGGQQYLADAHTLYGMARLILERPLGSGEAYTLVAGPSFCEFDTELSWRESGADWLGALKWSLELTARPLEAETVELAGPLTFGKYEVEELSVSRGPLGNVLRTVTAVPEAYRDDPGVWGGPGWFVARDAGSGAYFPYTPKESEVSADRRSRRSVFELYGDLSGVDNLKLIPADLTPGEWAEIAVDGLPWRGSGGYAVTDFAVSEEQLTVVLRPEGVVGNAGYCGGIGFLDGDGQRLFYGPGSPDLYLNEFTDWRDGSVTRTWSLGDVPREEVERIALLQFSTNVYQPLEDQAITVSYG